MKKITLLVLTMLLLGGWSAAASEHGLIAVAAADKTPSSQVSSFAARCPYFVFFDAEGRFIRAVENPHRTASGGASRPVSTFLANEGVTMLIAGDFGTKMLDALNAKGIKSLVYAGNATDAVQKALGR